VLVIFVYCIMMHGNMNIKLSQWVRARGARRSNLRTGGHFGLRQRGTWGCIQWLRGTWRFILRQEEDEVNGKKQQDVRFHSETEGYVKLFPRQKSIW